jgi:hypothetical protein
MAHGDGLYCKVSCQNTDTNPVSSFELLFDECHQNNINIQIQQPDQQTENYKQSFDHDMRHWIVHNKLFPILHTKQEKILSTKCTSLIESHVSHILLEGLYCPMCFPLLLFACFPITLFLVMRARVLPGYRPEELLL